MMNVFQTPEQKAADRLLKSLVQELGNYSIVEMQESIRWRLEVAFLEGSIESLKIASERYAK